MSSCKTIGCLYKPFPKTNDFCIDCLDQQATLALFNNHPVVNHSKLHVLAPTEVEESLSDKYPQYYKPVGALTELDVYAVHHLFDLSDSSGCLHHASKKLLLSGVRTGGKSAYDDIKEARDTLTRWLQLNKATPA